MPVRINPLILLVAILILSGAFLVILLPVRLLTSTPETEPPSRPLSQIPYDRVHGLPLTLYEPNKSSFQWERLTPVGQTKIGEELQRLGYTCELIDGGAVITARKYNGVYLNIDCQKNSKIKMVLKPNSTWQIKVLK